MQAGPLRSQRSSASSVPSFEANDDSGFTSDGEVRRRFSSREIQADEHDIDGNSDAEAEEEARRQQLRHSRRADSRPRLVTETLQENEELHERIAFLDGENRLLRDQVEDLHRQMRLCEEELRAVCRRPQLDPGVKGSAQEDGQSPNRPLTAPSTASSSSMMVRPINSDTQSEVEVCGTRSEFHGRLGALVDMQAEEILKLRTLLEAANAEREQLEQSVHDLQEELEASNQKHQEHEALIQELTTEIQEMQRTLSAERQARQAGGASEGADSRLGDSGVDSLAEELSYFRRPSALKDPAKLLGHLLKKSPSMMRVLLRPYQRRFVVVEGGRMSWWASARDHPDRSKCSGSVDFSVNPCVVEEDPADADKFSLRPLEQVNVSGFIQHEAANGMYQRAEMRGEPTVRFIKVCEDFDTPMMLYWDKEWYIGPDTVITHALASKEGPDAKEALSAKMGKPWLVLHEEESGQVVVALDGAWVAASFTGAHTGRVLEFSCAGCEHNRERWLCVIRLSVEQGRTSRRLLPSLTEGPLPEVGISSVGSSGHHRSREFFEDA